MEVPVLGRVDPTSLAIGFVTGIVLMLLIWMIAVRGRRTQAPGEFGALLLLLVFTGFFWYLTKEQALGYILTGAAGGLVALSGARAARAMMEPTAESGAGAAAGGGAARPVPGAAGPATTVRPGAR